ncbi:MAG: 7TM-DISM domain-containing protein, partial [Spirochaetota bacterium]
MKQLPIIVVFIFIFTTKIFALSVDVDFPDSVPIKLKFIEDKQNTMSFDDVVNSDKWDDAVTETINFGFTDSAYWFTFTVNNTSKIKKTTLLRISYPMLDYIELYRPTENGGYNKTIEGDSLPFHQRELTDVAFLYLLEIYPGTNTFYFKIKTTSSFNFTATLFTVKGFLHHLNVEEPLVWVYYGLMIIMVVFNFFVFLSIKDISYLLYVVFISSWILLQMCLNGYSFQYFW